MRVGTTEEVIHIFQNIVKVKPIILRCQNLFLMKLKGVIDPEKKRIAIGNLYIKLFEAEAKNYEIFDFSSKERFILMSLKVRDQNMQAKSRATTMWEDYQNV